MAPVMLPGLITNNVRGFFFIQQFTPPGKKPPQRCTSPVKLAENILRKESLRNHGLLSVYFLPNSPFNASAMAMFCRAFYLQTKKPQVVTPAASSGACCLHSSGDAQVSLKAEVITDQRDHNRPDDRR
ncbi:hypothetical protein [Atlantibacter hermannii]|uniref:hypothetical protein n=1 Tax=Atlantibacter hermannii TaxID=565 RepID=UPI0022B77991|nr:hypothetical protein [Atlantibacter hermannii]MCZ7834178.1 hypothetical protein [Atlantibacter hermannii]